MSKNKASLRRKASLSLLPPPALLERVNRLGYPENFFVGLPPVRFPTPRNILMFPGKTRSTSKDYLHHRYLLILNLTEPLTVLLDGCRLGVRPGQALLVFPFQGHRYLAVENKQPVFLCITLELSECDALEHLRNLPVDVPLEVWQTLDAVMEGYPLSDETPEISDEVTALVAFILLRLLRQRRAEPVLPVELHEPLPAHRIVQRAHHLINTRIAENIPVKEIAYALAISEGHLRACFRKVLGYSVSTGIRRTKVYNACSLLSRTEMNISIISERCGFGSIYAFSRAFKREIGMAPTRYRAHLWKDRNIING